MDKRILISTDFLMNNDFAQIDGANRLFAYLRRSIETATGVAPELFISVSEKSMGDISWQYRTWGRPLYAIAGLTKHDDLANRLNFSRDEFFYASDLPAPSYGGLFHLFNSEDISCASYDYLSNFLHPGDLLIGYELSAATRDCLNKIGVLWIDIWLHPIRFFDDVLMAINSSHSGVNQALTSFNLDENLFWFYADMWKLRLTRGLRETPPALQCEKLVCESALFAAQMMEDKSLLCNGKMLSILDFTDKLKELGNQHSKVYYSRHPFIQNRDACILDYLRTLDFVQIVKGIPTYFLLASGKITKVASISSSVVAEALYFGIPSEYYYRPPITFGSNAGEDYVTIGQDFISPHFWSDTLSPIMPTRPSPKLGFLSPKDKLRDTEGFYWGYMNIDKVERIRLRMLDIEQQISNMVGVENRSWLKRFILNIEKFTLKLLCNKRLFNKYQRSRKDFFGDSKRLILRTWGRLFD